MYRPISYPSALPKDGGWTVTAYGSTKAALDRYTVGLAHEVQEHEIFVNCMRPTSIVLTEGADFVREVARANPSMLEPVEMMAEGALELCTGRAASYRICRGVDAVSRNTVSYGLLSNLPVQDSEERQLPVLSPRHHAVERDGYCFFTASPQTLRFRCYDRRSDRRQSKINRHDKSAY